MFTCVYFKLSVKMLPTNIKHILLPVYLAGKDTGTVINQVQYIKISVIVFV